MRLILLKSLASFHFLFVISFAKKRLGEMDFFPKGCPVRPKVSRDDISKCSLVWFGFFWGG